MHARAESIRQHIIRWYPPAVLMFMTFMASSLPASGGLGEFQYSDKLLHGAGYAVMAVLCCRALGKGSVSVGIAIGGFLMAAAYGASDEFHQWFVPSRSAAMPDFYADATGAAIAAAGWFVLMRRACCSRACSVSSRGRPPAPMI